VAHLLVARERREKRANGVSHVAQGLRYRIVASLVLLPQTTESPSLHPAQTKCPSTKRPLAVVVGGENSITSATRIIPSFALTAPWSALLFSRHCSRSLCAWDRLSVLPRRHLLGSVVSSRSKVAQGTIISR
jgi:hypothetical protein